MKRLFSRLGPGAKQALNLTGVNGIFWFAWAFGNYQNIYLQQVGFSPSQLGLLNAIASAVGIASVAFWGMVSDRLGSVKKVLIAVLGGGALFYSLVPLIPAGTAYTVLALTIALPLINFFRGSMSTFAENLLVRNCNELRLNYGLLRGLGSILFTVGSLIISSLLPFVGVGNTFWLCGVLMLIPIAFTFFSGSPAPAPGRRKSGAAVCTWGSCSRTGPTCCFWASPRSRVLRGPNYIPYFMAAVDVPSEQYGVLIGLPGPVRGTLPAADGPAAGGGSPCYSGNLLPGPHGPGVPGLFSLCPVPAHHAAVLHLLRPGQRLFIGSSLNYLYELAPDHLKASAQAFFVAVVLGGGILGNLLGGVLFDGVGRGALLRGGGRAVPPQRPHLLPVHPLGEKIRPSGLTASGRLLSPRRAPRAPRGRRAQGRPSPWAAAGTAARGPAGLPLPPTHCKNRRAKCSPVSFFPVQFLGVSTSLPPM